jgi:archaellum component FlaC
MFKNNKLIAMLLLTLVVVFAVISEYNLAKRFVLPQSPPLLARHIREGFDDDDVPSCQTNGESPACYSTVRDYDEDSVYNYDDMYLKTEIVPPICPACPTTINGHCHENEVGTSPTILGTDYKNETQTTTTTTETETNNSVVNNYTTYNSNNDTATDNNSDTAMDNNSDTTTDNNSDTSTYNNNDRATYNNNDRETYNNTVTDNNMDTVLDNNLNTMKDSIRNITPTNDNKDVEINRLKEENKRLKDTRSENDSCPPCPSCERCPEASFSCEKVINYKSPNVGNYLPIPLLNDFSTFDSQ